MKTVLLAALLLLPMTAQAGLPQFHAQGQIINRDSYAGDAHGPELGNALVRNLRSPRQTDESLIALMTNLVSEPTCGNHVVSIGIPSPGFLTFVWLIPVADQDEVSIEKCYSIFTREMRRLEDGR